MPPPRNLPRVRPAALRAGDKVGIVAPASAVERDLLRAGCDTLRRLGYEPVFSESIFERDIYFAGTAQRRARELEQMFAREEVRAILCARGGYGCNTLLEHLDVELIRRHPKIFMGYSDVTTLLTWLADAARLVVFHGPMVTKDFASGAGVDLASFQAALQGTMGWRLEFSAAAGVQTLRAGQAEGELYGGCLSLLAASLGTPYEIRTKGRLLFLEDVAAKPYQIDRMLMQLRLAGKLEGVAGLIFGEMLDCVQAPDQAYTLEEVILRVVGDLNVPVVYGVPSGHVSAANLTLPMGVQARLDAGAERATLEFRESATEPAAERKRQVEAR